MSLNARMSQGDPRLYNPSRDVAHNFGAVMMEVARRCESGNWSTLTALAHAAKLSDAELGAACEDLCRFVTQDINAKESMAACMARSGFLDRHPTARVILMAYMGAVVLGMHWAGVREVTLGGVGPLSTYQDLRWHGKRCAKLMTMPWWKRRLYQLWHRVKGTWRHWRSGSKLR